MTTLHYRIYNPKSKETPVVLLHGFLESSDMWKEVRFPENYPRIEIDLPGHGNSRQSELLCDSIREMAEAVLVILNDLDVLNFHIIGHSMGGYVGLEVKRIEARAQKLMLLNSNFWTDSKQKVKDRIRVAEIVRTNQSHFIYEVIPNLFLNPQRFDVEVKELIREAMEMSPESIAKASIAMSKRDDFTEFVRSWSTEITCIQGVEDRIVQVTEMRQALTGGDVKYIEIEDVGHMAHFEAPEKLNELVSVFLEINSKKNGN